MEIHGEGIGHMEGKRKRRLPGVAAALAAVTLLFQMAAGGIFENQLQDLFSFLGRSFRPYMYIASVAPLLFNLALDALVNYKYAAASAEGIRMVCQLDVPTELFVEGPDLCIILENLLNNAMEAVRQLTDEKDKWISLSVRLVKDVLLITVENPFNGAVASDGSGKLRSSSETDGRKVCR